MRFVRALAWTPLPLVYAPGLAVGCDCCPVGACSVSVAWSPVLVEDFVAVVALHYSAAPSTRTCRGPAKMDEDEPDTAAANDAKCDAFLEKLSKRDALPDLKVESGVCCCSVRNVQAAYFFCVCSPMAPLFRNGYPSPLLDPDFMTGRLPACLCIKARGLMCLYRSRSLAPRQPAAAGLPESPGNHCSDDPRQPPGCTPTSLSEC